MIPAAFLQAWSTKAPWPDLRQVEQDLIVCRALCDLFNAPPLAGREAIPLEVAVHLTAKPARFDALAKRINGLQEPLMIEWE